ncbi:MAG: hypothetical protein DHS20C18_15700 [Saprospiraceae bacterium]|nr:MAG: hypothetical protein DHS20C18_15700 [Saprospiraceae bacterium]
MRKSKAIQLLRSLNALELDRLRQYAQSPYCNHNKNAQQLLEKLHTFYPDFSSDILEKKRFFKKVYPQKKYNEAYLRKQLSGLYQMTKSFLATESWNKREDLHQQFLLHQLQERGLDTIFQIHFDQFIKELQDRPQRDGFYFHHAYQLARRADQFYKQQLFEEQEDALQAKVNNLDVFYLVHKLKGSCEMISRNQNSGAKYRLPLVKELVAYLEAETESFLQFPAIAIYLQVLKVLVYHQDTDHYFTLIDMLTECGSCFTDAERTEIYGYAKHYCLRQIRQGDPEFLQHLLNLYQNLLREGLPLREGYLPEETYQKIIILGLKLKEFDWTEQFIFDYKEKLPLEGRDNIFQYQLASLNYEKGQFQQAIKVLKNARFSDIQYEINGQYLLLKTYFDSGQLDHLIEQLDTFNLRLMRMKVLSSQEKHGIKNFLVLLKRISQLYTSAKQWSLVEYEEKKQKIKDRLDQADPIFKGHWLQEIFAGLG